MPDWVKISHTSFSVRDMEEHSRWYQRILDLRELERVEGPGWRGIVMVHEPSGSVIEFQQHEANAGEPFDPVQTGFDHMGLLVDSREELDRWQEHFEDAGVDYTPVVDREYGAVLTFRDPDQRQLEMFYRENHP